MKPRPRPRFRVALRPAVLAAAAALALTMTIPGPLSAQSLGGWKRGSQRGDAGSGSASRGPAEFAPGTDLSLERSVFYSNLGLLESVCREAATAIADSLGLPSGSAVTLFASTPHEANWFVGNIIGETLAERGYKVRILDWGPAPAPEDSSGPPPASPAVPAQSDRLQPDSDQSSADQDASAAGSDPGSNGEKKDESTKDGANDGTTAVGTSAADSDSTPAGADSVRGGLDGEATSRTLPDGEVLDLRVVEFGVSYSDVGRKLLFGPLRFTRVGGVYIQVSSLREPEGELRQVLSAERHRVDRLSGSQRALAEGASYPFKIPQLKAPGLGRYIEPTVVVGIVSSLVYLFYANQSSK